MSVWSMKKNEPELFFLGDAFYWLRVKMTGPKDTDIQYKKIYWVTLYNWFDASENRFQFLFRDNGQDHLQATCVVI